MEEKQQEKVFNSKNNIDSKAKKLWTILGMSLLLLIPIGFLSLVISDRTAYRNEAIRNVIKSWADP